MAFFPFPSVPFEGANRVCALSLSLSVPLEGADGVGALGDIIWSSGSSPVPRSLWTDLGAASTPDNLSVASSVSDEVAVLSARLRARVSAWGSSLPYEHGVSTSLGR